MPQQDLIELILILRNLSNYLADTKKAADATAGVGEAAEKTGKKASVSWKSIAKWGGAATAVYGAQRFIRGAVTSTVDLAKSTAALQRQTNLDTKSASEWVNVLKERNINTKTFQMGLVTLSKQMLAYGEGSKTAAKNFAYLSIGQQQVAKSSPDKMLLTVADRLKGLRDPTLRAAEAQKLFGRAGLALLPLLSKGRKGIQEQLDIQERYGNYLSGKSIKDTMKLVEQQREMEAAYAGVKLQLGTALIPVMTQLGAIIIKLTRLLAPLTKNALLFKIAIAALATAFIAYKIAMVTATIATTVFETAALPVVGIVLAIVAGVALLAVGFYLLYTRVGWFRNAVQATFAWIKKNWPLLVAILFGAIGLAVLLIVRNWAKVKGAFVDAYHWLTSNWPALVHVLTAPFRAVIDTVSTVIRKIKELATTIANLPGKAGGLLHKIPGGGLLGHVPGFQHGGVMSRTGPALVGEAGPELLTLPRGAQVAPLAVAGAGAGPLEIIVPLYVDKRELARAVATVASDKLARR